MSSLFLNYVFIWPCKPPHPIHRVGEQLLSGYLTSVHFITVPTRRAISPTQSLGGSLDDQSSGPRCLTEATLRSPDRVEGSTVLNTNWLLSLPWAVREAN